MARSSKFRAVLLLGVAVFMAAPASARVVVGPRGHMRVVRPLRPWRGRVVRPWVRHPYYGTVVAGVTLGTIIAMSAEPEPPAPELCWYWINERHTEGYWDRCD